MALTDSIVPFLVHSNKSAQVSFAPRALPSTRGNGGVVRVSPHLEVAANEELARHVGQI